MALVGLVGGHENYQSVLLRPTKRNAMPTQVAACWRINTIFELELDLENEEDVDAGYGYGYGCGWGWGWE